MKKKVCSTCKKKKAAVAFLKSDKAKDGLTDVCRSCTGKKPKKKRIPSGFRSKQILEVPMDDMPAEEIRENTGFSIAKAVNDLIEARVAPLEKKIDAVRIKYIKTVEQLTNLRKQLTNLRKQL